MKVVLNNTNNQHSRQKNYSAPSFKGNVLTSALALLDTNDMANAVLIDLGAMVGPRTYYDTKQRNKEAGFETFFREISGTFINCLSAGLIATGISYFITNKIMPETKLKPITWYSTDAVKTLHAAWTNAGGNTKNYVNHLLNNISGKDGLKTVKFSEIDWANVNWTQDNLSNNIHWKDSKFKNIAQSLKTKDGIVGVLTDIIADKNIDKSDAKNVLKVVEAHITNALGANRDLKINLGEVAWNDRLSILLRDTYNMGKDIFTNNEVNIQKALSKIEKVNKIKIFGALSLASLLGLTNQKLNRKLTEKRTGKKGFVGDVDYMDRENTNKKDAKPENKNLFLKKLLASAGMVAMVISVMRVKNPKDFVRKLQFTGPVTSGNAIKTVYATNIVGRFMAADNDTELRESVTRDYFGFLNWLVFGGFAAKGVANLLDRKRENLFNEANAGKGLKHWLNDVGLKTHEELRAKGKVFARKNIWKLNVAHISGLLYSGITLGYLLPMLNDKLTKKFAKNKLKQASTLEQIQAQSPVNAFTSKDAISFVTNEPVKFQHNLAKQWLTR